MDAKVQQSSAAGILEKLFGRSHLAIRLWSGETFDFGGRESACTLVFNREETLRDLVLHADPMRLASAYVEGNLDIEGSIYPAIELKDSLKDLKFSIDEKLALFLQAMRLKDDSVRQDRGPPRKWHSGFSGEREKHRRAIGYHYDVSNEFYRLWLDEAMNYSCAYFTSDSDSLEKAQKNKLDLICRKLRLREGEHFLDIGCGWGGLLIRAATHYGVIAHGITLSRNQHQFVKAKIAELGIEDRVTVELKDYHDLQGEEIYDKIASVGMFEHVGLKNLNMYFSLVHRLLMPGGLFLNHGITHDEDGWVSCVETEFINRYVFPDGELDWVSNVLRRMEECLFEIHDVESMLQHYALTLREWVRRLESNHADALQHVSERLWRIWRLYMAACALQFEAGYLGLYQILAAKKARRPLALPLTRNDLLLPDSVD